MHWGVCWQALACLILFAQLELDYSRCYEGAHQTVSSNLKWVDKANIPEGRSAILGDRVLPAVQKSLQNLKLEYLDLYLIHWPVAGNVGPTVKPPIQVL